jgi:hypothetical protein
VYQRDERPDDEDVNEDSAAQIPARPPALGEDEVGGRAVGQRRIRGPETEGKAVAKARSGGGEASRARRGAYREGDPSRSQGVETMVDGGRG